MSSAFIKGAERRTTNDMITICIGRIFFILNFCRRIRKIRENFELIDYKQRRKLGKFILIQVGGTSSDFLRKRWWGGRVQIAEFLPLFFL